MFDFCYPLEFKIEQVRTCSRFLRDWSGERCAKILENCWNAVPDNGMVIMVECVRASSNRGAAKVQAVFQLDLAMLA